MRFLFLLITIFYAGDIARGGILVMSKEHARKEIEAADAVFEAKAITVSKKTFISGEEVSEDEFLRLKKGGATFEKLSKAINRYKAVFEVTKTFKGDKVFKSGSKFTLEWDDSPLSLCPHVETRAIRGSFIWTFKRDRDKKHKPFVSEMVITMRNVLGISDKESKFSRLLEKPK